MISRDINRRRLLQSVALGGVGAAVLAACGETVTVTETKVETVEVERIVEVEKEVAVEIEVIKEVAVAAEKPAARKNVELRVMFFGSIEDTPSWQRGLDIMKGSHPHISYVWEDTAWGDYWTKLNTMVAGGSFPDVLGMVTMYSQQYIRQGVLMPLKELSERDNNHNEDFWPANFVGYKDEAGEVYGFPYDLSTWGVFYNVDLLEEVGANRPIGTYSWEEFVEMTNQVSLIDGDRVERFGTKMMMQPGWTLDAQLRANDAGTLSKDGTKSALSDPKSVEVFEDYQKLVTDRIIPTTADAGDTPLFEIGRMGFYSHVPSQVQTLKERVGPPRGGGKFAWDVAYQPEKVQAGNTLAGGGFSGTMEAYKKHPEETWEFLSVYTSSEVLRLTVAEPSRGICGRQSCSDAMLTPDNAEHQEYFLDNLDFAAQWCHPAYNEIVAVQTKYFDRIFWEGEDAATLLAQADVEIDPLLEEGGAAVLSGY